MSVSIKDKPVLVRPAGSHWLELGRSQDEPFSKEELFPILEVNAPRVGLVRVGFECSRYVASSYDEKTGVSSPIWSDWRIWLRDVHTPDPERPDVLHLGRDAAGIGQATQRAISAACEPVIREWLESDGYKESRSRAAAYAIGRELDAPTSYRIDSARRTLERVADELAPAEAERIRNVLDLLERAVAELEREPITIQSVVTA